MTGLFGNMATSARAIAARLSPKRFMRREDGTVTAFAVIIFILMVGASGIAIDVMRYETQRVQLQYTLDRAILAAAALTQPYDPEGVVRDYFEISGIEGYRLDVRVEEGVNFRRVHAYAELEVRSLFMQLFGVRVMTSPAIGAAEERMENIEVSLVLDISGSMGNNNRMVNLKPAARDFVSEVLIANDDPDAPNMVSISIVPYNDRVNVGEMLGEVWDWEGIHNSHYCARFLPDDFLLTGIDPTEPLRQLAHFNRTSMGTDRVLNTSPLPVGNNANIDNEFHCQRNDYGAILPWQHDEALLHAAINALDTEEFTAIDEGMKWGVALLDPAAAPAVQALVASGDVNTDFSARPANYVDGNPNTRLDDETIKVVVLMTDGANTEQWDIDDAYRAGPSPIFWNEEDECYSIYLPSRDAAGVNPFWVTGDNPRDNNGNWRQRPCGGWEAYGMTQDEWDTLGLAAYDGVAADGSTDHDGVNHGWPYLWARYTREYIAEEWLERAARGAGDWSYHDAFVSNALEMYANRRWTPNPADVNLRAICDAANAAGIIVYTIAFEAPPEGEDVMRYCASADANYYDVDGLEISEAFASIARAINELRLVQ